MKKRKRSLRRGVSLLFLLILFAAGCEKTALYHNLSEGEVNGIIVVLYEAGINAEKVREVVQNETFWNVTVNKKDMARARQILVQQNLPRKEELGLSGVYKDKGLIPTPDEQKARFLLAIKGEIINSLEKIPEVVDADIVINIPTPEEFATNGDKRPTASIVLKIKPEEGVTTQLNEAKVQQFVANSVEELNPRDVSVIFSYLSGSEDGARPGGEKLILPETTKKKAAIATFATTVSIAGIKVSKDSATRLKIYMSVFFGLLILISAVLVIMVVRTTRMKQEFQQLAAGGEKPLLEGEVAEELPRLEPGETGENIDEFGEEER